VRFDSSRESQLLRPIGELDEATSQAILSTFKRLLSE
jgi:hypothetical protein